VSFPETAQAPRSERNRASPAQRPRSDRDPDMNPETGPDMSPAKGEGIRSEQRPKVIAK